MTCGCRWADLLGGEEGKGFKQVLSALEIGRVNIAARAVGVAQEAYDQALAYSKDRHAFGQPIAEFQAGSAETRRDGDKGAGLTTSHVVGRLTGRCGWTGRSPGRHGKACLHPKRQSTTPSMQCGFMVQWDTRKNSTSKRLYRDAPLMVIGEGTNEMMRLIIARGLIDGRIAID